MSNEFETVKHKKTFLSEYGRQFLTCTVEIPRLEGMDSLNKIWEMAAVRCEKYCEEKLCGLCDPTRLYAYRVCVRPEFHENKIIFITTATLTDRTLCKTLLTSEDTFCIRTGKRRSAAKS